MNPKALFNRPFALWIFLTASSLSAFAVPLLRFNDRFLTRDWGFFNSLSHVIRSSWLHYKVPPFHTPYIAGGMDLLANPQSRVLSPMTLFDLFFSAPFANLLSLIFLSVLGSYGLFLLLQRMGVGKAASLITVFLFSHASWFALHYSEGHIVFGAFQLFPSILYLLITFEKSAHKVLLAFVIGCMPLDGAMYAFIYSCLLIFFALLFRFEGISFRRFLKELQADWKTSVLALVIFMGLIAGKIIPLLALHGDRDPIMENIILDAKSLLAAFFYPFQQILLVVPGASFHAYRQGFHEIGAYIGVLAFVLILYYSIRHYTSRLLPILLFFLFFFWIGSGIGGNFNPWVLFQKVPVLNNAHIQTRALFMSYLMLILLVAFALDKIKQSMPPMLFSIIVVVLVGESLLVSNYPYYKIYHHEGSSDSTPVFSSLIKNTKVDQTIPFPADRWGFHYRLFEKPNTASRDFMDPALRRGALKTIEDSEYKGEVYWLQGEGELKMLEYTPRRMLLSIESKAAFKAQVNTNYLLGWKSNNRSTAVSNENGLVTVFSDKGLSDIVELTYHPAYRWPSMILYSIAIILFALYQLPAVQKMTGAKETIKPS